MRIATLVLSLLAILEVATAAQQPFPPKTFQNLQVMPKAASAAEVIDAMKGFTRALGVRCQFCHVGEEGLPLEKFDFVSDAKPQKTIARNMMRMLADITRQVDAAKPAEPGSTAPRATCYSCHHGQLKPAVDRP